MWSCVYVVQNGERTREGEEDHRPETRRGKWTRHGLVWSKSSGEWEGAWLGWQAASALTVWVLLAPLRTGIDPTVGELFGSGNVTGQDWGLYPKQNVLFLWGWPRDCWLFSWLICESFLNKTAAQQGLGLKKVSGCMLHSSSTSLEVNREKKAGNVLV